MFLRTPEEISSCFWWVKSCCFLRTPADMSCGFCDIRNRLFLMGKQNSYFKPNHHILLTITISVFVHTTNQSIRTQTQSCNTKNRFGFSLSVVLHKLVTRFRWLTWICVRSTYSWYEILVLWLTELLVHEYLQLVALNSGTLYCVSPPLWVTVHLMSCALQGKDRSSTGEKEETSTFILHRILKSDYRRQYH